MTLTMRFIRTFFFCLTIFLSTSYTLATSPTSSLSINFGIGVISGVLFSLFLMSAERFCRQFALRSFNVAILGLFLGYLMGIGLILVFDVAIGMQSTSIKPQTIGLIHTGLILFSVYLCMSLTSNAAEELYLSIPFFRLKPTAHQKKDILIDTSILSDARIIDVAASGLLDHHLILPRFVVNDLHEQLENSEETYSNKARRSLDVLKKLESLSSLELRYIDTYLPDVNDSMTKFIKLARLHNANILTADISRIQQASVEGVVVINIHSLSNALKPIMQAGETIDIKVQRYGKEPRQGVGYLEDGTMVVINGGGNYIGQVIQGHVLSVKHTSSGRMIFCNALEQESAMSENIHNHQIENNNKEPALAGSNNGSAHKDYFSV